MAIFHTVPLSQVGTTTDPLADKLIPVGVPYKRYLDSRGLNNYLLAINVGDELDLLLVTQKTLDTEQSLVLPNSSLEYLLNQKYDAVEISNIINVQLAEVFAKADSMKFANLQHIIYLENTTQYLPYLNKTDNYLITDPLWKYHEQVELAKLSGLTD